ncbi:MAG: hypothetical protein P4L53_13365 [Candidatus Obscuribacterales bacterium]|nr:hypothetical protein [Candidatus Obscuribacterales bacterium]
MSRFFARCLKAAVVLNSLLIFMPGLAAQAQPSEAQMEKALDVMDKPSSWNGPGQGAPIQPAPLQNAAASYGMAAPTPMFNHQPAMSAPGAANPFTLQNALRIMLGGSSGPSSGAGVSGNDSENLQTALDQKQQAIDACNSISGESDKGVKQGLASQAQDHANAASYAADALYNASNNSKSQEVHNMASRARNAANEAQSYADRARSKADGGGW